ncbi:MAG: PhoH family protein [Magnetococcales bacterium]|nr:PhoH family protein [Magnetococcales bacterium]
MVNPLNELVTFADNRLAVSLFGEFDRHLKLIEKRLAVSLHPVGNAVVISAPHGETIQKTRQLLESLYETLEQGRGVDRERVEAGLQALLEGGEVGDVYAEELVLETPRRAIHPRNTRQTAFIEAMTQTDLTLAVGPAGTGKTYLAVAVAVVGFLEGRVARIVLTRPAVEAGERLGFLPGDLNAKVDPYLRPLYDALNDMLGFEKVERMLGRNALEIAPLAYMRGRTLNNAFIILDEAQNTTLAQMKMFLTRLGEGSRAVVAGDVTQVDLPRGQASGLVQALEILAGVEGVSLCRFGERDVVRHPLVQRIVRAYEQHDARQAGDSAGGLSPGKVTAPQGNGHSGGKGLTSRHPGGSQTSGQPQDDPGRNVSSGGGQP